MCWKRVNKWLRNNEHLTQWIIAFATLVVAIPIIYGWVSGKIHFPFFPISNTVNTVACNHIINVSCVCDYRDKNGYLNFKEQKCRNLSIGQSINITTEELSQYFTLAQNSQIIRFTITKNSDATCIESGNCRYSESAFETISIH